MSDEATGRVASERAYTGKLLKVDLDTVVMPNGSTVELEIVRHPGAAAVVPFLSEVDAKDPSILLISQYRYAAGGRIWEIPAGILEKGEDPADCARRELKEETGATCKDVKYLTTVFTTPGFTDERIHLFLATGIEVGTPVQEDDEDIEIEPQTMSTVLGMIRDGEIKDGKTIAAILYVAGYCLRF